MCQTLHEVDSAKIGTKKSASKHCSRPWQFIRQLRSLFGTLRQLLRHFYFLFKDSGRNSSISLSPSFTSLLEAPAAAHFSSAPLIRPLLSGLSSA